MAKFKNLIVETGFFTFENFNYEFAGEFETEDKALIAHLSARNDWIEIAEKKSDELEELKKEAKSLKIKFDKNASVDELKKLIEEAKSL